jgi:hypothetical protein
MEINTVSFDYDKTLSRLEVQEYAAELIERGYNVHVVTARYSELQKHRWKASPHNEDLWEVIDKLGIPHRNVHFTNMDIKSNLFKHTPHVLFHLDDDAVELLMIANYTSVPAINSLEADFKEQCEYYLSKHKLKEQ